MSELDNQSITALFFAAWSLLASLLVICALFATNRLRLHSYDYIFILLQLINILTQSAVIVYETHVVHNALLFNSMVYLGGLNILGVVFTNLQSLTIFSVLDYRITRERIVKGRIGSVILFFLFTGVALRNLIVADYNEIEILKNDSIQTLGQIGIVFWNAVSLFYDNGQAYLLLHLLRESKNTKRKRSAAQIACSTCQIFQNTTYIFVALNVLDWIGILFGITSFVTQDVNHLVVSTIILGLHSAGVVLNFYLLRHSAIMDVRKQIKQEKLALAAMKLEKQKEKVYSKEQLAMKSIDLVNQDEKNPQQASAASPVFDLSSAMFQDKSNIPQSFQQDSRVESSYEFKSNYG